MHLVQALTLVPSASLKGWRFGFCLAVSVGFILLLDFLYRITL